MRLLPKAIAATLGVQAIIVMASLVVPLTAAGVAPRLGLAPHLVGYYASLTFLAAAFASLATPQWVRRYGAIRLHQIMLLVAVAGLAVLRSETLAGFVISALLLGLAYGPANPASSSLLARYTAPDTRARVFALKQTAVPLGAALAGFAVPLLMTRIGWPSAVLAVAAICLLGAILVDGWRKQLDGQDDGAAPVGETGAIASLRLISGSASLRPLGVMAVCFAATQFNFTAVFAAVLVERMRWSPVEAGTTLSIAMAVSVGSRLGWGWAADHAPPRLVLAALGAMMAAATVACASCPGMAGRRYLCRCVSVWRLGLELERSGAVRGRSLRAERTCRRSHRWRDVLHLCRRAAGTCPVQPGHLHHRDRHRRISAARAAGAAAGPVLAVDELRRGSASPAAKGAT